jgi:hypothetical protein
LVAVFVAGYVAVIMEGRGVNQAVMFALYGVGIVALISMGVTHATWFPRSSFDGIPGEGLELTRTLLLLVFLAACTGVFLWWGTVRRNRKAAVLALLVGVLVYPLFRLVVNPWNLFPEPVLAERAVSFAGVAEADGRTSMKWTGLRKGEFFAPHRMRVDWYEGGKLHSILWGAEMQSLPGGDVAPLPRAAVMARRYGDDRFREFWDAAAVARIWEQIRTEAGVDDGWRFHGPDLPETTPEMSALCWSARMDGASVSADGVVFRIEKTGPVVPVVPGRVKTTGTPGMLEIKSVATGGAKVIIELVRVAPSGALGGGDARVFERLSSPPRFRALLVHRPTRTAYAAIGLPNGSERQPLHHLYFGGARRDSVLLTFLLPRFESGLLGLDSRKILAESELYLFRSVPAGHAGR